MARTEIHDGKRIKFTAVTAHSAGDLVYHNGWYGICQDDYAAGELGTLILEKAWNLRNGPSTVAMGVVLAAPATEQATTLPLLPWTHHASLNAPATAGWFPIGRLIATGNASLAPVDLFGNAHYY